MELTVLCMIWWCDACEILNGHRPGKWWSRLSCAYLCCMTSIKYLGLARTVYTHRIWPMYGDFPAKNTVCTPYIPIHVWFWPTLQTSNGWLIGHKKTEQVMMERVQCCYSAGSVSMPAAQQWQCITAKNLGGRGVVCHSSGSAWLPKI